MPKGVILKSASFDPGGDEARQMSTQTVLEKAGFKVEEPEPEPEESEQLTPQQQLEKNLRSYGAQVKEAKEKYNDWRETVGREVFIGQGVQMAILEQANGAEVCYYLGKHPNFAAKLGELSKTGRELTAIREVERLSARLAPSTARTQAPPRRPVRPPDDATFSEIAAMPNFPGKGRALKRAQHR